MKRKLMALMLACIMVLMSVTACGSNDDANTDGDDKAAYVQGITDTEVLIANTAATSGAYAPVGVPFNAGIEAYLKMVNEEGGIDGRTITFLHKDDEFDPVKGKSYLQEMVEDEEVFAMVGHFGTPVVAATVEDLKDYGIPSVYFATGIGQLYAEGAETNADGYNIFPVQPIYTTEGRIMVARCVGTLGAKKIGIIYTSDDAGMNMLEGAEAQCKENSIEIVSQQVAPGAADVSAAVTAIKNEGVDAVIVGAIQATMPTIVKEMAAQGMTVPAITTYVNVSYAVAEQVAADIEGKFDVYGNGWVSYEGERADNLALYTEYVDAEYALNPYAQTGWIAAHYFCEGLRRLEGKEVTWASYMEALEEAPIMNPFGGEIDFSNGKRMGTTVMNLNKVNLAAEGGVGWEVVDTLKSISELLGE